MVLFGGHRYYLARGPHTRQQDEDRWAFWYHLFGRVRLLIADIPATQIHDYESTRMLVDIGVKTLNQGQRSHLTRWQARYRHWYAQAREKNPSLSPQELQQTYSDYDELITDMTTINEQLQEYADELKKLL